MKLSQVTTWMSKHYGCKSASYYNSALTVIRTALDKAVQDKIITENPASGLKYRKRNKPIRLTPTYEQFNQIVTDIRSQKFNHEAEQSGDFIEFMGLAGLGQAEISAITRAHVDLEAGRVIVYRRKTEHGFAIPIYPQLRSLVERLCRGKETTSACSRSTKQRKRCAMHASGSASLRLPIEVCGECLSHAQSRKE